MAADSPATATVTVLRRLIQLDTALSLQIHTLFLPVPRPLLKLLEISGDGRFWFPIPIALLPLSYPSIRPFLLSLLLGSLLDLVLVGLIKFLIRRPRPVYNKGMHLVVAVDHWSFPSGHSSRVFFVAAFLRLSAESLRPVFEGYKGETLELFLFAVLIWSAATSVSRVLLGRHFVLDVVAGACLGIIEALFVDYLANSYIGL